MGSMARYFFISHPMGTSAIPAVISSILFVVGMALLGSSKLSGYFYLGAIVLGLYVSLRLPLREIVVPRAVQAYLGFYLAFALLVLVHLMSFPASFGNIDQVSRIGVGLVNGLFFLALFGFSRERLFDFVIVVAAAHSVVAIATAFYQGMDFLELALMRDRVGGVTNPIPFSEMLLTSIGLVTIFLAGRVDRRRPWRMLGLLGLVLASGIFAVVLTGTRGTLVCFFLLLPLLVVILFGRLDRRFAVSFGILVLAALLPASIYVIERDLSLLTVIAAPLQELSEALALDVSTTTRLELWVNSIVLIGDAPLFGHGLGSFPEVFHAPELGLPPDSVLLEFNHVHNQYLDVMLEMGLLGTVLFFGPMVVALVAGARMAMDPAERVKGLALVWVAGAYAVYGLTTVFFAHASTTLQYGVYLGMLIWLVPAGGRTDHRPEISS